MLGFVYFVTQMVFCVGHIIRLRCLIRSGLELLKLFMKPACVQKRFILRVKGIFPVCRLI